MKDPIRNLLLAAFSLAAAVIAQPADKVSRGDGLWNTITWSPTGTPIANDIVHIEDGFSVNYNTGTSPNFSRIYVGDNSFGAGANGTLEVSGGILTVNANAAGAYIIGRSAGSTGTVNITGGTLRTTGASGGGLQLGFASGATGNLNISSGALTLTASAILGAADGATGNMTVSGGTVTTSTGTNNAIFYVGGRITSGSTVGTFEQTGGSINVNNNSAYFAVGYAGASQDISGTARLTGGNFSGNVRVGRQSGTTGTGSGSLIIGPNANVTGRNLAWDVSGNGNLEFALGSTTTFHAVDLTTVTASNALTFSEAGAKITVDGTSLVFSGAYAPVTFINFASGKGPDATSKSNVIFNYTGFDAGFTPTLLWKDTGLRLYLYGMPDYGYWLGGSGTWTNTASPFNWSDAGVTETGDWGSKVATFGGTAGTVTVDDGAGPVVFTGATFNTSGYVITGDSLTTNTAATSLSTGNTLTATIASPIVGSGGLAKDGLGTVILSGANTYTGATVVNAGTLRIEGDQLAATGAVTVATGAVLAGAGRTGGAVTVQNGGTLSGQAGQVFTMNGLTLGSSANLDVALDAPSTARLFQVNGNLTLDGTLNVTAGASFGPGVYRLIDYTGSLTNNGLSLGTVPVAPTDLAVQTSVANQVNLIFNATTQNFWAGGSGVWTADPSGTAWDNFNGTTHGAWQPQLAIFQGAPGVVTVDTTAGAVVFTGTQFAADGYTVAGGNLTTNTANTVLRVGDGSAPGAAFTATISAAITGSGGVEKTDLGTLVLSGVNTYAGGTTITDGMLQLGNGGTTGSVVGDVANNGTLAVNRSDTVVFNAVVSGAGGLRQQGSGALVLTGANTYTGNTIINAGTLQLGNGGTTGSITGNVANAGIFAINRSDAYLFNGAISGAGDFQQSGSGTTTLTGANTYTGGTTIAAGTLQLGNGGATGGITGNVVNNATLAVNRSDAFTLGGLVSGSGTLRQSGSGTTTLTGANTYAGATSVNAGTLLINGNQSAATGAVTVASGATLGGSGQTGGVVSVQSGGTLRGQSGQTFTAGGLVLGATSTVNVSLGAASTSALFQVNGNLVLDGTLNVADAGAFGQGLYRLFNYTGSLTDNGLVFGTLPGGVSLASLTLQTSVANQVNLFYNDTTSPLPSWTGGSGTWSVDPTSAGWGNGSQTGGWRRGFAVLSGTPGTVTVNAAAGPVEVLGIQFASDGYLVTGDAITNTTPSAAFRVGDGTAAGANMTATIAAPIIGGGSINKTDLGTLVLAGTSTYTGGTSITGGTLQVGADANLGASTGGLTLAGGTLRAGATFASARNVIVTGSGSSVDTLANNLTLSGVISGTGSLTKRGAGRLILSGNNTFTGATVITQGGIFLDGGSLAATTINSGASLMGNGRVRGNLTNNGTLSPGASPGTVTVSGNFTQAATGIYAVEIAPAAFDRLVVDGTATLGGTLTVTGIDGYVPRPGQSFKIIEAGVRVTGQFATVAPQLPLPVMLSLGVNYNSNDVTLAINQRSFAMLAGSTTGQVIMGRAVDGAVANGAIPGLRDTLNGFMSEGEVKAALAALSPGVYGRWFEQAVYTSSATMRSAETRLAEAKDAPRGLWMELVRRDTRFDPARDNPRAKGSTDGIIVGGDLPVGDRLRVGALFGYTSEDLNLDQSSSSTTGTERFNAALYGRYTLPDMFVEAVLGAGMAQQDNRRTVAIPGYLRTARSSADTHESFASVRWGRPVRFAHLEFIPYLGARYVNWSADAFNEAGADDANLKVYAQTGDSLAARAGLAVSRSFAVKGLTLTPRLDLAVQQELFDKLPGMVAAEIGGTPFALPGRRPKSEGFLGAFGLDVGWKSRFNAYVRFAGESQTAVDQGMETRVGFDFHF